MRKKIVSAISQYAADNGLTFERHVFVEVEDTLEDTVIGVYLQEGQSIMHMLQCVEKTVLCSSKDANLISDFYTLIQHRTKHVSPGTVLVYFPMLKGKICNTSAFDGSVSVDRGIPLTQQDVVFRNALDRYIRRFGESFPLFQFQGTMNDAIYTMNTCVRRGKRYNPPLWDANGNPILYYQNRI